MRRLSYLLIRLLGVSLYCRIPQRLRRSLGMVCGEDFSDINTLLHELHQAAPSSSSRRL